MKKLINNILRGCLVFLALFVSLSLFFGIASISYEAAQIEAVIMSILLLSACSFLFIKEMRYRKWLKQHNKKWAEECRVKHEIEEKKYWENFEKKFPDRYLEITQRKKLDEYELRKIDR